MAHTYAYGMIVEYFTPIKLNSKPDYGDKPGQEALQLKLTERTRDELPKIIESLPMGTAWEVNSHNLTLAGDTFILSVMLQRPVS